MRDARRTLESAEEFDSSRFFLEALLATTTYETFLGLMTVSYTHLTLPTKA